MTFGETIKAVRTRNGLSQSDLAKRLGTTQQYIYKLEHDTCVPRQSTIIKVMLALDAANDFISFIPEDNPSEISETIILCQRLSNTGLSQVNRYIKKHLLNNPKYCNFATNVESDSKKDEN